MMNSKQKQGAPVALGGGSDALSIGYVMNLMCKNVVSKRLALRYYLSKFQDLNIN